MKTKGKSPKSKRRSAKTPRRMAPASRPRLPVPQDLELKSILVPTDFSPASEKALAYAVPLAHACGASLTLIHVVEPVATPDFVSAFPLMMENDRAKRECKKHLANMVDALSVKPGMVDKLLVRSGRAFNEIAAAARTLKADLIVISTHGLTGLKHALLGSTTERVVQHAPCPVLVVRPTEREFLKFNIPSKKEDA